MLGAPCGPPGLVLYPYSYKTHTLNTAMHPLAPQVALILGSDPGQPAMVPANDLEIGTGALGDGLFV